MKRGKAPPPTMGRKQTPQREVVTVSSPLTALRRISTGSIVLDTALKGGIPLGTVTVISGRADTGKTLLCSHIVANAVKAGMKALILDLEGRFLDPERLLNRGLTPEEIEKNVKVISSIFTVEDAARIIRGELTTNPPNVIVIDSIASLQSFSSFSSVQSEDVKGGIGETARAFTREFRDILYGQVQKTQTALILTTQKRTTILPYGAYESDYLPNILRHAPATYIQLKTEEEEKGKDSPFKAEKVKEMTRPLFKTIIFSFEKNQYGFPHARGVTRYFLFSQPEYGINIGDWDLVYEVCGLGSVSFFRVVRPVNEDGRKAYISPSGTKYYVTELYTKPEVRHRFLSEAVEPFVQKMIQFWSGGFVSINDAQLSDEEG